MDRFTELCIKYRTPKVKLPWNSLSHDYAPHYNRILEGRTIKRILEIGCGPKGLFHPDYPAGGSLLVWAEMFPEAIVFGFDIDPATFPVHERILCFKCDQSKADDLLRCSSLIAGGSGPLDLIVDDGSHRTKDQLLTAKILVPSLSADGVYVIEDVVPRGELTNLLPFRNTEIECGRTDVITDDRLIIIEARNRGA
jgi:hypothetical protein